MLSEILNIQRIYTVQIEEERCVFIVSAECFYSKPTFALGLCHGQTPRLNLSHNPFQTEDNVPQFL